MDTGRYKVILMLQYLLLAADLFMNSFTELLKFQNVILLVLYVIQDICIVFAVIVLFLNFFTTYIFQAGLIVILIKKFKMTIIITFLYLAISIALHVHGLQQRWSDIGSHVSLNSFWVLFGIQRSCAVFYYYFYKRTALVLGDTKYYKNSEWINEEFLKRQ